MTRAMSIVLIVAIALQTVGCRLGLVLFAVGLSGLE